MYEECEAGPIIYYCRLKVKALRRVSGDRTYHSPHKFLDRWVNYSAKSDPGIIMQRSFVDHEEAGAVLMLF
jgi:hypothetical protein